jgi:hypothetical protein
MTGDIDEAIQTVEAYLPEGGILDRVIRSAILPAVFVVLFRLFSRY